ncbi:WD40 repeat-like protein [Rhizodiscina lignyota]|uniref:WD40 repeat-like protein n=1 Tax=Rhizodiscina lignyota TaxID=1504668 RepID=A0A9P4ICC6_9PEZI|nr:WD40 repeat-like protein [Rhizodiscina lignyota]
MRHLKLSASSSLSLPPDSYIYNILPLSARTSPIAYAPPTRLAALCSDDSVRILDAKSLEANGVLKDVNESVTCLERFARDGEECNVLATTGRDGRVRFWDVRTGKGTERQPKISLSALECSAERNCVVAGAELEGQDGPGDAPIFVWDTRNLAKPQHVYTESHTDTVTELLFHPSVPSLLLTASTDSLINLIDVTNPDEDEAVHQVINHKSALHHAGFLNDTTVYGLGTDETLSFYRLQQGPEIEGDDSVDDAEECGDVREALDVEYIVKIEWAGTTPYIVGGKHSAQTLDIIPLGQPTSPMSIQWKPQVDDALKLRLDGAHGEEIVRDVYVQGGDAVYTCGEDGTVKVWSSQEEEAMMMDEAEGKRKKDKGKGGRGKEGRYKPY